MGTVYAVYDDLLDRRVALKLVKNVHSEAARRRMLREGQAMARLSHPNVVPVFEVGDHQGQLFIAMEYVQGVTLRQWLDTAERTPAQIVATYVAAGRGLAAAHAEHLVHRDFKPDNAVVGHDDRVRVLDFGLAASATGSTVVEQAVMGVTDQSNGPLDTPLTRTGVTVGTPAYMAPEQYKGERVDHRADQFSLCVALWEALHGERPFPGATRYEIFANIARGKLATARGADVPVRIQPVLERGLRADPNARWPTMEALLTALVVGSANGATRRRVVLGVGGLVALGAASLWGAEQYQHYDRAQRVLGCETEAADALESLWNDGIGDRVRAGLEATAASYATTTADNVVAQLDAYAGSWAAARTDACVQTRVERQRTPDLLERSMWCLDKRAMGLRSMVEQLEHADRDVMSNAVVAVAELAPTSPCLDAEMLKRQPPPPGRGTREGVPRFHARLAQAASMYATAKYDEALVASRDALAQSERLGDPALVAAARSSLGMVLGELGQYDEAEMVLLDAYFGAANSRATETVASVSVRLLRLVGNRGARYEEGLRWGRHADVALTELGIGPDDLRRCALLNATARIHSANGDDARAMELTTHVLKIQRRALGPRHPAIAPTLGALASVHWSLAHDEQAKSLYLEALALHEEILGEDHPTVGYTLVKLGRTYRYLGDLASAEAMVTRAMAILEATHGPDHADVAHALGVLGEVHWVKGDFASAKALLERALAIEQRTLGPDHLTVAITSKRLGDVCVDLNDASQAREHHARALRIREQALDPDHLSVASSLGDLGDVWTELGDYDRARTLLTRALHIRERVQGPEHTDVALTLMFLARIEFVAKDYSRALPILERGATIYDGLSGLRPGEPDHRFMLAQVLLATGGSHDRAVAQARIAADGFREWGNEPTALAEVEAWIASR